MKIISKFKDYYDYLQGIYGIDDKLILDRTSFYRTPYPTNRVINIHVCGYEYEGVCIDGKYYWEKDIEAVAIKDGNKHKFSRIYYTREYSHYYVLLDKFNNKVTSVLRERVKSVVNDKLNCPIVIKGGDLSVTYKHHTNYNYPITHNFSKFPILTDYNFNRVIGAEDLWIQLSNWLSRSVNIPNNQTNNEKIISAGFDLKTSFRNVK